MIAHLDSELRYNLVNRSYAEVFGTTVEAIVGKSPSDFLDPILYATARPMMERALAGETVKFESQILFRDGRRHWFSVTYAPDLPASESLAGAKTVSQGGPAQGIYALMVDIDDYKRAEEAQRSSEQRFRDIVSASSDWFWETDSELRLSYLSERAADLGGIEVEKQIGRTLWAINDRHGRELAWNEFRRVVEANEPFRDFRCRYKGGVDRKTHNISVSGLPLFDENGRFIGYRGSANDITKEVEAIRERERIQEFFVKALELLNVSFGLFDPDDILVYWSSSFESLARNAGWNVRVGMSYEMIQREIVQSGSIDEAKGREEEFIAANVLRHQSLKLGETIGGYRVKFNWPDGSSHWTEGHQVKTLEGYTLVAHLNVTDLVSREEQLRQAQKMEAVGQLTGGIAHDFNNILAVVLGNLDLVIERAKDHPECVDLASKAVRAAERGALLTQRLLAFSRKQPLIPRPTDVNSLIGGCEDLLRRAIGEHNELEFVRAAGLWRCEVDPSQIENAMLNLAINARDSMPEGGKLTIETANAHIDDEYAAAQVEVTPGQYVMIAVTDTGVGMSDDVKAHVFEPFFTTKEVGQGSGLGLSMVYGFVKQSGGHISIYSEVSEGTTIKIYLPRTMTEDEQETLTHAEVSDISGAGQKVLVVEDDPLVRELAHSLLSELDYRVVVAESGSAALKLMQGGEVIDLLLTDAVLPGGMNGRELATAVTALSPDTAVLYMSGYTENAIIHHGRLDADAVLLQKPFRKKDLVMKLREVMAPKAPIPGASEEREP